LIRDGVTVRARFRLTPPDRAVDVGDAPNGIPTNNGGKGMFLLFSGNASAGLRVAFALDVDPAAPGQGLLHIGQDVDPLLNHSTISIPDPTAWLDVWLTVEDADGDEGTSELRLNVYLNGMEEPILSRDDFLPNEGVQEVPGVANGLCMGLNLTADSGSMEVDVVSILDGAVAPKKGVPKPIFHRGDPNDSGVIDITDGVYVLNYLFLGQKAPTCLESADANDDGRIDIADAIYLLSFLFIGGPQPFAPGPPWKPCGPDRAGSKAFLGCESYTKC
jgi:hypothetical protein